MDRDIKFFKMFRKINRYKTKKIDPFWIQTVKYRKIKDRVEFFKGVCRNKRILHIGCTDWPIFNPDNNLHIQLNEVSKFLHGFDIDREGIENLRKYVNQQYFTEYSQAYEYEYDICLIPETIEHVDNVQIFLTNIFGINASTFIITAPNCFSDENIKRNKFNDEYFYEFVHPDHNCWYSPFTLRNQIEKYSLLKVKEVLLMNDNRMVCCICEKGK